jgi:predicted transcriptional regulator
MDMSFPSIEEVRAVLEPLTLKQMEALAERSGVPFTTIYKIKRGETKNPGIETLRQFVKHIEQPRKPSEHASAKRGSDRPSNHREGR